MRMTAGVTVAGGGDGPGIVLVVEDDAPTRKLLGSILAQERLPFHLTATGHEAMEFARHSPPAMVVLDVHLPSVRGDSVATALRIEYGKALPILAMSAANEQASAEQFGAFDYLQKPFNIDDFVSKVRRGLELAERSRLLKQRSEEGARRLRETMARQRQAFHARRQQLPTRREAAASN